MNKNRSWIEIRTSMSSESIGSLPSPDHLTHGNLVRKAATLMNSWISSVLIPWRVSVCQTLWFWMVDLRAGSWGEWRAFCLHQQSFCPLGKHTATLPLTPRMQFVFVLVQSRVVVAMTDRETGLFRGGSESWIPVWPVNHPDYCCTVVHFLLAAIVLSELIFCSETI